MLGVKRGGKFRDLFILLWIILVPAVALAEDAPVYQRMAVIGDSSIQKSGLTDLVSIELQRAGVQLVEREKLAAVIGEQTLAAVEGADATKNRVELGKLVKADALVLLEQVASGDGKGVHLRMVIAECHQGARLYRDSMAIQSPEKMAAVIAQRVVATRKRFAGGITGIVGVPPFIARNFTYEYHPLQKGYAALLEDALSSAPGIAVLELDEAQAIRKELETAGGKVGGVMPTLVEGEFEVIDAKGQPPTVNVKIRIVTAAQPRTVERKGVPLADAAGYVWRELPGQVLSDRDHVSPPPFAPEVEFARLVARADEFAALGEWRHAIDLREAALVIRPENADQRSALVDESIKLLRELGRDAALPQTRDSQNSQAIALIESCYENSEWLIHAGRKESIGYAENVLLLSGYPFRPSFNSPEMRNQRRRFLATVWPLTYQLGKTAGSPADDSFSLNWRDKTVRFAAFPHGMTREDFDILYKFVDEVIPESERIPGGLGQFLSEYDKANDQAEFFRFLDRLDHSARVNNRLLALVARVGWHHYWENDISDQMLEKIDAVIMEILKSRSKDVRRNGAFNLAVDLRQDVMFSHQATAARIHAATQPALRPGPISPPAGNLPSRDIVVGPLHFEDVAFNYKQKSGKPLEQRPPEGYGGMDHLISCGDALDVFWDRATIAIMRELGTVQAIVSLPRQARNQFQDVQWDGAHLWASTTRQQIQEFDTDGKAVASIGADEGLPPIDAAARLVALAPDRIMVAGCFGPTRRAFLALITRENDAWKVNVFFKASRVLEAASKDKDSFDADLAFVPSEMIVCRSPGGVQCVVVKRDARYSEARSHPLIINAKTLAVTVCPTTLGSFGFAACAGGLLQTDTERDLSLWMPDDDCSLHRVFAPVQLGFIPFYLNSVNFAASPDGTIYAIGTVCNRVDPKSMTVTRLARPEMPLKLQLGYSRHFGFVAWDGGRTGPGRIYRMRVDEEAGRQLPPEERFSPAPPEAEKAPDGMWLKIISASAKTQAVGDGFTGPLLVRNVGRPKPGGAGGAWMRVSVTLFHGTSVVSHCSYRQPMADPDTPWPWGLFPDGASPIASRPLQATESGEFRIEIAIAKDSDPNLVYDKTSLKVIVK